MSEATEPSSEPWSEPSAELPAKPAGRPRTWPAEVAGGWPVALVFAVSGLGVGLLWVALAPEVPLEVREDGIYLATPQPWQPFATQAVFGLLGLAAGLVAGAWAWGRARRTPFGALGGLLAGGTVAAVLAWQLGVWLGPPPLAEVVGSAQPGDELSAPLAIDAWAVLLAPAVGALLAYLVLDLVLEERVAPQPEAAPTADRPPVSGGPPGLSPPPSA